MRKTQVSRKSICLCSSTGTIPWDCPPSVYLRGRSARALKNLRLVCIWNGRFASSSGSVWQLGLFGRTWLLLSTCSISTSALPSRISTSNYSAWVTRRRNLWNSSSIAWREWAMTLMRKRKGYFNSCYSRMMVVWGSMTWLRPVYLSSVRNSDHRRWHMMWIHTDHSR